MINKKCELKNGFWINCKGGLFDLLLNEELIIKDCINFSYVSNALIITKKKNTITIFSIQPIKDSNGSHPNILAVMENSSYNIFAEIVISGTSYIVDCNCQVTCNPVNYNFHPKIY